MVSEERGQKQFQPMTDGRNHMNCERDEFNRINRPGGHRDSCEEILRECAVQKVLERMETFQAEIVQDVDRKLSEMIEKVLNEVKRFDVQNNELKQLFRDQKDRRNKLSSPSKNCLPAKEFIPRNSLLFDLFEVKHIRTIYHIFVVILILLVLNTFVHDFVADGKINFGLHPIRTGFGEFYATTLIWLAMQFTVFSLYYLFTFWAQIRCVMQTIDKFYCQLWDWIMLLGFVGYQVALCVFSVHFLLKYNLPEASSFIILMEMVRFLMKSHAFVRSNTPRVLAGKTKAEDDEVEDGKPSVIIPQFSTYAYFLFAPTLVYRDNYPRTKIINWKRVAWYYCEVIGVIIYISFIFERFVMPYFLKFGDSNIEPKTLVLSIFGCMMPGMLMFLCGFYLLLHAWMNASAEMLRFADRMFYKDWWNSTSFDVYYRTWNVVVHDWLYTYIFKDVYECVLHGNKTAAAIIVFTVSAIVHEFILAVAFRFCYPVLFVMFETASILYPFVGANRDRKAIGNCMVWLSICLGTGLCMSLYSMEYYARINCPISGESWTDYFIPVSWSCHGIMKNVNWKLQVPW